MQTKKYEKGGDKKMEETTYLEPVIEEEDIVDLEEDSSLIADTNNTCESGCACNKPAEAK